MMFLKMKFLKSLAIVGTVILAVAAPTAAQVNGQMKISYCRGQVAASSNLGRSGAGTVEAASYIPKNIVSRYRNLHVVGINAGLASKLNLESLTVWVRETLDSPNIMECTVTKGEGIVKGWNNLALDTPAAVSSSGFYIGYTLQQKGGGYAVSAVGQDKAGALYFKNGSEWTDISQNGHGCLSIEAIIEADNLPRYDLAVIDMAAPEYVSKFSDSEWSLTVANRASLSVNGINVEMQVEGAAPQLITFDETLQPCEERTLNFKFAPELESRAKDLAFTTRVINPSGEEETPEDNIATGTIDFDEFDFRRNVMIEEFTTEVCVNCPSAAAIFNEIMHSGKYAGRVNMACHHAGYYTDFLTVDADNEYVWMYGGGSFCPGVLYDRSSAVMNVGQYEMVEENIDKHLAVKAGVSFSLDAEYNPATNMVDVKMEGGCDWDKSSTPLFATVYLIENAIPQRRQKGAPEGFVHNHVTRQYNAVWGDALEFDKDERFSYSCSLPVEDYYVRENMEVVAFVHRYDFHDRLKCGIENSGRADIDWDLSGIHDVPSDNFSNSIISVDYYDLYGNKISAPAGFTVKRVRLSDGTVRTEKIIIP